MQEVEEVGRFPNTVVGPGPQSCVRSTRWDIYCDFSAKEFTACTLLDRAAKAATYVPDRAVIGSFAKLLDCSIYSEQITFPLSRKSCI